MTQEELGHGVGLSNGATTYYETEEAQPPRALLADRAITLEVNADELLGLKPVKTRASPKKARLLKRLQRIEELPLADQRAVLKFVDALLESRRRLA